MNTFTDPDPAIEYARARWAEGEQRLGRFADDSNKRQVLEQVIERILQELEKSIGQIFSTLELAAIQDRSEPWCTDIAHTVAPEQPWAWDLDIVQNAAFHRYSRRANDYQAGL